MTTTHAELDKDTNEPVGRGIAAAFYAGGPTEPYFQPLMECSCGWGTGRCLSWAEAGQAFDDHLEASNG